MLLDSRVALVFGAGSRDGRAVVALLVKKGCRKLTLGDHDPTALDAVVEECKGLVDTPLSIIKKKCDTNLSSDVDELIAAAVEKFGEINYCANCERPDPIHGITTETTRIHFVTATEGWQRGVWLVMRAEVRQFLVQKGKNNDNPFSIVNVAAAHGRASAPGLPSYCAAAHSIVGMTRATAMDYVKDGIRINCVCPGPSKPIVGEVLGKGDSGHHSTPPLPIGRYVRAEEVAEAVVFLLGDGASAITGIELPVDGGWSLYHH